MDARIRYSAADDLMRYRWLREVSLSADYMKFLDLIPINNPLGLLTSNYSAFLQEYLSYGQSVSGNTKISHSLREVLARARADGATLDLGDEEKFLSFETLYKTDSVAAIELFEKYRGIFEDASTSLSMDASEERLRQFASGLRPGTGQDVLFGIIATDLMERVRKPLSEEKLAFYRNQISTPAIYSEIERINSELAQKLAEPLSSDASVIPALQSEQSEVFKALTEPYLGNVVYIDFWAPWCGPCMANMPAAKSLKEDMAGKNVVFLYLGVLCSEESWENTIKSEEIAGKHYLLSKDEYALLSSRFNIDGIPRYMLVDKEGNLIDDDAEAPYSEQIRFAIQTLLD